MWHCGSLALPTQAAAAPFADNHSHSFLMFIIIYTSHNVRSACRVATAALSQVAALREDQTDHTSTFLTSEWKQRAERAHVGSRWGGPHCGEGWLVWRNDFLIFCQLLSSNSSFYIIFLWIYNQTSVLSARNWEAEGGFWEEHCELLRIVFLFFLLQGIVAVFFFLIRIQFIKELWLSHNYNSSFY